MILIFLPRTVSAFLFHLDPLPWILLQKLIRCNVRGKKVWSYSLDRIFLLRIMIDYYVFESEGKIKLAGTACHFCHPKTKGLLTNIAKSLLKLWYAWRDSNPRPTD